jgi:hypothetical protein
MIYAPILIPLIGGILLIGFPKIFIKASTNEFQRVRNLYKSVGIALICVAGLYLFVVWEGPSAGMTDGVSKPNVKMHRIQAQTPSGSDWFLAKSTEGSFSVLMPIPFNDFTVGDDIPGIGSYKSFAIGAQSVEGIKISAVEMPLTNGRASTNFDETIHNLEAGGSKISEVDKTFFQGWPAVSFAMDAVNTGAFCRYVQTPKSLYLLTVEYPFSYRPAAELLKNRFWESLKLTVNTNGPFIFMPQNLSK